MQSFGMQMSEHIERILFEIFISHLKYDEN